MLKSLLGHHLATNSFGLGRFFYKSSHQFQNFRPHGDQNGCNLEVYLPCPIALHYAILESVSGFSNDVFYGGGTLTYHPTPKLEGHVMQLVSPFYPKPAQHGWTHQEPKSQLVELPWSSRRTNLPTMLSSNTQS